LDPSAYQTSAKAHAIEVLVEKESLEARGLVAEDLLGLVKVVNCAEVADQWQMADVQVRI